MTARTCPRLFIALLLVAATAPGAAAEPKGAREPPQLFFLESGGQKAAIELDTPFETRLLAANPSATLRVEPYRVFPYAGLEFHYPREYTFEADFTKPGVVIWTLSGNSCLIMIQRFENNKEHLTIRGQVSTGIANIFAGSKVDRQCSLKLKDEALHGVGLEARIGPAQLRQDFYSCASGEDSIVLVLQDTPSDNGQPSADRVRAEKMLCETLRLPAK